MAIGRSFSDLTKALDDAVDKHLGDTMTLIIGGNRYPLVGTHAIEEVVRVTDGGESVVVQRRLSVQERLVPLRLATDGNATLERRDPYAPGEPVTVYRIRSVEPGHSGRVNLVLGKAGA